MRAMVLKANPLLIDMFSSRRLSLDIQRTTNIIPGQLCCLSCKHSPNGRIAARARLRQSLGDHRMSSTPPTLFPPFG